MRYLIDFLKACKGASYNLGEISRPSTGHLIILLTERLKPTKLAVKTEI